MISFSSFASSLAIKHHHLASPEPSPLEVVESTMNSLRRKLSRSWVRKELVSRKHEWSWTRLMRFWGMSAFIGEAEVVFPLLDMAPEPEEERGAGDGDGVVGFWVWRFTGLLWAWGD
jgi:hypothetical protein